MVLLRPLCWQGDAVKRYLFETIADKGGWQEGQAAPSLAKALEYKAESDEQATRFPIGSFVIIREEGKDTRAKYERTASGFRRAGNHKPAPPVWQAKDYFDARTQASRAANALGHGAACQGCSFECWRCDRSGSFSIDTGLHGAIFSEACDVKVGG